MSRAWIRDEIVLFIKSDLLLRRLDLASVGVKLEDIQDDTPLLDEGLALDSVDALDLLVAVEKTFDIKLPDLGRSFIERTCKNVQSLADFIVSNMAPSERVVVS